jgi:hypothetical protein
VDVALEDRGGRGGVPVSDYETALGKRAQRSDPIETRAGTIIDFSNVSVELTG